MSKIKVLIVEDDRLIAENSAIMLEKIGYESCNICNNAEDAIQSIQEDRPDIVLVDILLTGKLDGITLAGELRQNFDIPFVYVTATYDDHILERAKLTSPYGYIIKPFNERDLHSNIEMALYKFGSERKIGHLNEMLYALNEINQLNVENDDKNSYLETLCQTMAKFPSFQYVWAGIIDKEHNLQFETHDCPQDIPQGLQPIKSDGTLANCIQAALNTDEATVDNYPNSKCPDCSLANHFPGRPLVTCRFSFEDDSTGVLAAVVLPTMAIDPEFLRLFQELAHKVGSRLNALFSKKQIGQTKKALEVSEERFQRFTEIAPNMIIVHDLDGKINYINPSVTALLGFEPEDLLGKNLEDLIAPRSIAEMDERAKERNRGNHGVQHYDLYVLDKDSSEIPVEISSNPMLNQGEIYNILLIGRDLRNQKSQEAELKKLSSVVEQSPAAILITDSEGRITYINPKFTIMTGFSKTDVIGEFPAMLKTESITDAIATDLIQTTSKGEVWKGELETLRSNGEKFWIYATITTISDTDDKTSYIGIIEDITEKKQAALELELSKKSYEDIFNSTNDAIYIQDKDGKFIDVNQGVVKMYGYEREYFIGKSPSILSADGYNDLDEVRSAIRKAYGGEPQKFEFWGKRKDGSIFPKEVQVIKIQYFGKEVILATARDISDRKQYEEDLKKAVNDAEKSEEVKGYFLANMSHEIRTPLTSIVGYIDLIFNRIKGHLSDQDGEYFDIIRRNSDRLTRAVHSIIDLSEIEAGAKQLETATINLSEFIHNVYQDQKVAADNKKIKFTYHQPKENYWIDGDRTLLYTAISNLIDNAINYTDEGQVDLFLTGHEDGSFLLEIRDTGIGIAKHSLESIFESFNQESMGYTKDYQGLGLGLTIAKKNFEMHNLKIDVKSEKGQGSAFFVRFPEYHGKGGHLQDEETETRPPVEVKLPLPKPPVSEPTPASGEAVGLKSVLIVEDDENAQRLFGLFLKNHYTVHFATTVKEGRECLESNSIDLVVTDLSLVGGEDGLALVSWIRTNGKYDAMPVIALTAHAFISDKDRCLDAGCNDFITKPIFRSQLIEIIQKNLDR